MKKINRYLKFLTEQQENKIQGKLALLENMILYEENNIMLIFEYRYPYESFIPIKSIKNLKVEDSTTIMFDDRSSLAFSECIKSRKQKNTIVKIGRFSGSGHLEFVEGTNLIFTTNLFPGTFSIGSEGGTFFSQGEQKITIIK